MRHGLAWATLGLLASGAAATGGPAAGFVDLFNGKDLAGWVNVNTRPDTWSVRDGVLVCSGRPLGVMRSENQYENFVLHIEWMHLEPGGNSGVFIWSNANPPADTRLPDGVEVQMLELDWVRLNTRDGREPPIAYVHGELFGVGGVTIVPDNPRGERSRSIQNLCRGRGEWNAYDVVAVDGVVKLAVNGTFVNGVSRSSRRKGYLCLESEGGLIHFRNIRILELPPGVTSPSPPARLVDTEAVGRRGASRTVLPVNQVVTPTGVQVELPGLRPQALALSPDGRILLTAGKTAEIVVVDPSTAAIRQRVPLPKTTYPRAPSENVLRPDEEGQISYTGLAFAPGGRSAYLSDVNGSVVVFDVAADGTLRVGRAIRLPDAGAPRRKEEIPAGLAVSPDGARLYVCGNLSNTLLELAVADGRVLRRFDVGVAPYDVVLTGGKAYVSNWGGRRPAKSDLTGPAGRGTEVKVDPVRHVASEGSVTVVDLATGSTRAEIVTGLHASALAVSPDGHYVVCANAASDTLSVIDSRTDAVVETIWAKPSPADLFGAQPNALAFDPSGRTLYVANGTQNAVAVVAFDPANRESTLQGLVPVGWFPGALVFDAPRRTLQVANIKGHPATPKPDGSGREAPPGVPGFNSHHYQGSLSLVPLPADSALPALSETVWRNLRRERIAEALLPPRPGQPARAVPERIGEPSLIKHVVYVIKENRTYDQVLGDVEAGSGDPRLCIFGARITPNQHKLVHEFVLLDNTYCAGILSADGHQWSTTAIGTDYLERSFAGWPRSYPDGMGEDEADALAYSPAGFIWDSALRHGVRIHNYGEFMAPAVKWRDPKRKGSPDFLANYRTWKGESDEAVFASEPMIETIRPFSPAAYVGWEMAVPDQFRADFIIKELAAFTARGEFPQLTIICLPNDHTSGTSPGSPTPAATVADNDLAFGRIVEALSHSPFWREMAILAIEDDPQGGWDHVSGYRTTAYVASPYAKRGAVVSTQYNTTSLLRTLEQILGLPPMNQFDASAVPMWDAFTDTPDFRPFVAVPANVPLDQMNPPAQALLDPAARRDAVASARMNFREVDRAPEDALNRILWRAMKGSREPYPEWAVTAVADDDDD